MTVRLSDDEEALKKKLARHLGTDDSGVMRQGLLKLARDEGITVEEKPRRRNS